MSVCVQEQNKIVIGVQNIRLVEIRKPRGPPHL